MPHDRGLAPQARAFFVRWVQHLRFAQVLHPSHKPIARLRRTQGVVGAAQNALSAFCAALMIHPQFFQVNVAADFTSVVEATTDVKSAATFT